MKGDILVKKALFLVISIMMILSPAIVSAKGGFDEFGYNEKARMFNGFYGYYDRDIEDGWIKDTGDAWLLMKWSKNWVAMEDQELGAWVTNHFTWYSNDYAEETFYGYDTRVAWNEELIPDSNYRVENFIKIMKVGDDQQAWEQYKAAGAYSAEWGNYDSGVPKYIVFQDNVKIYDRESGELIEEFNIVGNVRKGLGNPIF